MLDGLKPFDLHDAHDGFNALDIFDAPDTLDAQDAGDTPAEIDADAPDALFLLNAHDAIDALMIYIKS